MWMLPLSLHVNKKSDYDYDNDMNSHLPTRASVSAFPKVAVVDRLYSNYYVQNSQVKICEWQQHSSS